MGTTVKDPLVLVVDDDLPLRRYVRERTAAEGRPFLVAPNIQATMEVIKSHPRDYFIVFLDYKLQEGSENGVELLRRIQEEASDRVIAYMWTGYLTREIEEEAIAAGADGAFTKADSIERLLLYTTRAGVPLKRLMASTTDFLTGLLNPRSFWDKGAKMLRGAMREAKSPKLQRRYPDDATLLAMDMDHFKKVNDVHGHDAGTRTIQAVGHAIQGSIRDSDFSCRYGGDEFLVLLPGETLATAESVKYQIRQAVTSVEVFGPSGARIEPSITIEGAHIKREEITDPDEDFDNLFKRADQALQATKDAR